MSQDTVVGLFMLLGGITGALSGWVAGKILFLRDRNGASNKHLSESCGLALAIMMTLLFPALWWLAWLSKYPLSWLCSKAFNYLNSAPELQDQYAYRTEAEAEAANLSFYQVCGFCGSLLSGCLISAVAASYYGIMGGALACTAGVILLDVPATGLMFVFCIVIMVPFVLIPRCIVRLLNIGSNVAERLLGRW